MGKKTDNHNLDLYDGGTRDQTHKENTRTIEDRLPVIDTEGNLSNYTAHDGAQFIASDTGAWYEGDGSSWSMVTRKFEKTLAKEAQGRIDAEAEGYKGDNSKDIAQLFNDNPNGTFVLPAGDYYLKSELDYEDDANHDRLVIYGVGEARIIVNDTSVEKFGVFGTSSGGTFDHIELRNLTLVVDGSNDLDAGWGRWHIDEAAIADNLKIEGKRDHYDSGGSGGGDKYGLLCNMVSRDGLGLLNINFPDGDQPDGSNFDQANGVAAESEHVGTNIWMGCYLEEWWSNGYYVKDGNGPNILIGCHAKNCGAGSFRLGDHDMILGCQAVYDKSGTHGTDRRDGTLLDIDDAAGTVVSGFRAINTTSENALARIRAASESCTIRDVYIEQSNSQDALRVTTDGTGEDGVITLDNLTIIDSADTSVRPASVRIERENVRIQNSSIECTDSGSSRGPIQIRSGSAIVDGCRLHAGSGGSYAAIVGGNSDNNSVSRASFTRNTMDKGIYMYGNSDTIDLLEVVGNDLSASSAIWESATPDGSANVTDLYARDNRGFDVAGMADLSTVTGYFEGQRAADDGTNATGNNPALFVWDGSTWNSANDSVTPS